MEFLFFFLLSLLLFLTMLRSIFVIYKPKTQQGANEKVLPLPPGRTGWPLIGETIDYVSKISNGVPQDFVTERIKKYSSKAFKTSILGHPMVMLNGAEGNKFLFHSERKLVQTWFPGAVNQLLLKPLTKDDDSVMIMKKFHKRLAYFINGEGLHKSVGRIDTVMREHLDTSWDHEEIINVGIVIKKYTVRLSLWNLFNVRDAKNIEKISQLLEDLTEGFGSVPVNLPGTTYSRAVKASKLLIKELEGMIKQRKMDLLENITVRPTQDILSNMLQETDENGQFLKEVYIAFALQDILIGGYGTINSVLTFIMKYLAELPDVYHEVLREQMEIAESKELEEVLNWDNIRKMRYSWNVACEVLRVQSIGVGTYREVISEFTYAGFTIPKGWKIHSIANRTHMNPEYFPNPGKFDPSRFDKNGTTPYTFIPFGGGPRMCPGNEYAKVVILVFMHNIVMKFKWEKVIPNERVIYSPFPKCSRGLPIRLHPHKP